MDFGDALAGVSALVAIGAAWFAYQSADAAKNSAAFAARALELDEERRWDELTPSFEVKYQVVEGRDGLRVICRGPEDYSRVDYSIAPQDPVLVNGIINPNEGDGQPFMAGSLGPFTSGEARNFELVRVSNDVGGRVRIRLYVYGPNDQSWQVIVEFGLPGTQAWMA